MVIRTGSHPRKVKKPLGIARRIRYIFGMSENYRLFGSRSTIVQYWHLCVGALTLFALVGLLGNESSERPLRYAAFSLMVYGILWIIEEATRLRRRTSIGPKALNGLCDATVPCSLILIVSWKVGLSDTQYRILIVVLFTAFVSGLLYHLAPVANGKLSSRQKPGRTWFYAGLGTFFIVTLIFLADAGTGQRYFTRWHINAKILLLVGISEGALFLVGSAVSHFEHPVSGSRLLLHRGILNRLLGRFPVGPVRGGLTYVMLCSLPLFGWTAWHGRLLPQAVGSRWRYGLVDFSSGVVGYLIVVPLTLALTLHLFGLFERSVYQDDYLFAEVIKQKATRWLRKERTGSHTVVIIAILTAVPVLGYRMQLIRNGNWDWMEDASGKLQYTYLFGFEILCAWAGFFLVSCSIAHGLVTLRFIRDLGHYRLPLRPWSPDRRCGLGNLGRCTVAVSAITALAVTIPVLLYYDTIHLKQGGLTNRLSFTLLLLSVSSYLVMLVFSLVIAVWPLHQQMMSAKVQDLSDCNRVLAFDKGTAQTETTALECQRVMLRRIETAKCKNWPHGVPSIFRYIASLALPLLGVLGEHRLGSVLETIFRAAGR
jgi:hypothetical protein